MMDHYIYIAFKIYYDYDSIVPYVSNATSPMIAVFRDMLYAGLRGGLGVYEVTTSRSSVIDDTQLGSNNGDDDNREEEEMSVRDKGEKG